MRDELINKIESALNTNYYSIQERDLCQGCKYFESSWQLLIEVLNFMKNELPRLSTD